MTFNSERELLDKAIALREENRALKALIRQVVNDIKRTVHIDMFKKPDPLEALVKDTAYSCVVSRETLLNLLEAEGK